MESLMNCEITLDIDLIENISGGNQTYEISFSAKDNLKYKLIFRHAWDMRCSIENASIDRFCEFRRYLPEDLIDNNIFLVKNSDYIKYFETQVSGTRPIDALKHYILYDNVDCTIDVLTIEEPTLLKL